VREHTEKLRPPRALWVPFPLGRPFGAPNDPAFQTDVLRRLLSLFEQAAGPVIVDYERDAPESSGPEDEPWSCVLPLAPVEPAATEAERLTQALQSEVAFLLPWYNESFRRRGRTLFGLSGLTVEDVPEMAAIVATFAAGETPVLPPATKEPLPAALRPIVDDLKTLYLEGAASQPGKSAPGPSGLNRWLYHGTRFGHLLYAIRDRLAHEAEAAAAASGQPARPPIALIPNAFRDRPAATRRA
jgi:hypothetical protein